MSDFILPPGPQFPAALQGAWLTYRPFRFLEWCRAHYGETFTVKLPSLGRVSLFTRPAEIERIFALDGRSLSGGAAQSPLVDFAGDRSLMKLDGPAHREHREILGKALRPAELPDGGEGTLEQIREIVATWPVKRRFDLGAALDRLALALVADLGLGDDARELVRAGSRTLHDLRRAARPTGLMRRALRPRVQSKFDPLRRITESYLQSRVEHDGDLAGAPKRCIFHRMTSCPAHGRRFGVEDARDEMMTLLVAMMAGLSCGLKHALYWILRTPGTQQRLGGESERVFGGETPQAIMRRPYLDAVSKEILRYCPDIPFAVRRASADIEINGWRLPAGATLGIGIYLTHRRPSTFPDPERFWPERFLSARPSRFEYLPFGGGRRGCVAGPFYVFVQKLILTAVTERFRLRLCDRRANPVSLMAIVSSPSRPLWVIAEPNGDRPPIHGFAGDDPERKMHLERAAGCPGLSG
jgi:cytochrome P450